MTQNNLQVNSASVSDKGLSEKRPQNEDSFLDLRESGLFAVADGVGGAQAGDVASQMAMEILGEAFVNLRQDGDAEERMEAAIRQANSAIFHMASDIPQLSTMATTVVALHINGNVATIGHVGDSRLYRLDSDGNLYRETQDHSVVEEEVRAGRMTPLQAETHPSRNVISRALGAEELVEIDMKTIMFEPDTTFLVCSDGVTRHISDEELRDLLHSEEDTFAVCKYIKKVCYERGAEDNLTAVVVKIKERNVEMSVGKDNSTDEIDLLEEETVASVRPPLVNSAVLGGSGNENNVELDEQITIPVNNGNNSSVSILADGSTKKSEGDPSVKATHQDIKSYRMDENAGDGLVGTLLSMLPWVFLFAILAFAAYYIWSSMSPSTDEGVIPTQTQNLPLTSFEKNRRNVDRDPTQYSATNAVNPKDSIDYFLLGRAYLLQYDYKNAKISFEKAEELIREGVDPVNIGVLENEIALGLAIIDNAEAQKVFEEKTKEMREKKVSAKPEEE
ncbi:MAG: serine/threonine-protein phosphatase [Pyrinomonadaceae bacterium]|nr:serine/threonine-protein phosphatase [Pyrinomonadaceae bacterium]